MELSDWFNLVQQQMAESRENYERLKRLLADEEFGELAERMRDIEEWLSNGDSRE